MDLMKDVWVQSGALGLLLTGMIYVIRRLYLDGKAKDKRNDDFGERVLTVAVESRKAIEADTEFKRGLIERIDRIVRQ